MYFGWPSGAGFKNIKSKPSTFLKWAFFIQGLIIGHIYLSKPCYFFGQYSGLRRVARPLDKSSEELFTRLMTCETTREAWIKLKEEYKGDLKARRVQILNLKREFEMLRVIDKESVREFTDKVMGIVNKIWLLREHLTNQRVVEKILVSLLERFEHKIASMEDSKDLTTLSIGELMSSLQAVEQRQNMIK